jgi:EmrB/QacA subfamily drug resistance transporter
MVQYKYIALTNTCMATLMAAIDINIVLIALPAIFNGIKLDPFSSFQYLLWILLGYSVVTATMLVSFGRLSDMFGRVKLYNLGFAIFTAGSILLSITPNTGNTGAMEIIIFRVIQGVGGAFIFSNSAAIITDAFPENERGRALGINNLMFLIGSIVGLTLGGILAVYNWRLVFLIGVPVGVAGTIWSYWKLKEQHITRKKHKIDIWGNVSFAAGLILILVGLTYGLQPYGNSTMGWVNPWVITSIAAGAAMLITFPFIELRVAEPMFDLRLFRNRQFAAGNAAAFLSSLARGGVMVMFIVLLQGIWLPLHGYSIDSTPFWAGIFMLPLSIGMAIAGLISGSLSDKHGPRVLTTVGMVIAGITFLSFTFLSADFAYLSFAIISFVIGAGFGIFSSPNITSIMCSVPPEHRGAASGMRAALNNCGGMISQMLFFTIIIVSLNVTLPGALSGALLSTGASTQVANTFRNIPATTALFAALLGYNPIATILHGMGSAVTSALSPHTLSIITGPTFFANAIANPFMSALREAFVIGALLCFVAAILSALKVKKTSEPPCTTRDVRGGKTVQGGD